MSQPQPARPAARSPRSIVLITIGALVAFMLLLYGGASLLTWVLPGDSDPDPTPAVAGSVAPQLADLPVYWAEQTEGLAWSKLAEVPTWDGEWLTVKTALFRDGDAREPAMAMCALASGYWVTSGREFRSVRVLDKAGKVLVSRATLSEQCTWRG